MAYLCVNLHKSTVNSTHFHSQLNGRGLFPVYGYTQYCQYKKLICKLRLSSHCLCIETGRYKNVPLERRICSMCKSDVEDEYHFMLKCPAYNNLRKRYLKPYYFQRPSVYKLTQLLSTGNVKELCNVGKFIKFAFKERKTM